MKCQILFSGNSKKNINVSFAEFAHKVLKVSVLAENLTGVVPGKIANLQSGFTKRGYKF